MGYLKVSAHYEVDPKRVRKLNEALHLEKGAILYWMRRNFRVQDNWALIAALQLAEQLKKPLLVWTGISKDAHELFRVPTKRHVSFLFEGLKEVEKGLLKQNIPYCIEVGEIKKLLLSFIEKYQIKNIVTDFYPLKEDLSLSKAVAKAFKGPYFEVDATHLIPLWESSMKQEYAAYTFRPKVHKIFKSFLTPFPKIKAFTHGQKKTAFKNDWPALVNGIKTEDHVEISPFTSGAKEGEKVLKEFITEKLASYADDRNDPNREALSNLSPYLHFGFISAQRAALELDKVKGHRTSKEAFFEEMVVRRELSANYCYYNSNYDSVKGFHPWAIETLDQHLKDQREYCYSLKEFEQAQTHDRLWNAAQMELIKMGKIHGYMRMYWAKKILEWTHNYESAFNTALFLNDKYSLDGNDPNGYVGVAWSIGGVHDRPWFERPIFGKIRYMNESGCKRKFDVKSYCEQHLN